MAQVTSDVSSETLDPKAKVAKVTVDDDEKPKASVYKNTNGMPRTGDGKVLHVGVGDGEVANRVVTVGTAERAAVLAAHLDGAGGKDPKGRNVPGIFCHSSDRGFTTYTGTMGGVPVSIISIGMGMAMMDFVVREVRSVVTGPMLMVRFGTCGALRADVTPGTVVVASMGAVSVVREPDAFGEALAKSGNGNSGTGGAFEESPAAYRISRPVLPDASLSAAVLASLQAELPSTGAVAGLNATADSFYSSQGRVDDNFDDQAEGLLTRLQEVQPDAASMEMESFMLLDLARCSKGTVKAAATAIVVANRPTGGVVDGTTLLHVESMGGKAVLQALASHPL